MSEIKGFLRRVGGVGVELRVAVSILHQIHFIKSIKDRRATAPKFQHDLSFQEPMTPIMRTKLFILTRC